LQFPLQNRAPGGKKDKQRRKKKRNGFKTHPPPNKGLRSRFAKGENTTTGKSTVSHWARKK